LTLTPFQSVEISSEFNIEDVLKKNSKLKYKIDDLVMPESYNGLGFSNMVFMFIQTITYKYRIEKENKLFNILFIEEPESHLHPQMQSTFLRKISDVIGTEHNVYRILTTHSSYILQSADLSGVRYFTVDNNNIVVRSLSTFFKMPNYASLENFMKKYFKINTCDLFFADKAILVEGTVERMLISLLIQKFDDEHKTSLSKQHFTVIEVGGAYAHTFNELLSFLQVRTLIVTDIDSVSGTFNETCKCDLSLEGNDEINYKIKTSNSVIKDWFNRTGEKLFIKSILDKFNTEDMLIKKNQLGNEVKRIAFQKPTDGRLLWGRTFEEQFIIENAVSLQKAMLNGEFQALINAISKTKEYSINQKEIKDITANILKDCAYEIVRNIDKTNFALDLLMYSDWKVPQYIKEGLKWLEK
jgi:putative ATP-dependent endonuclease of the OLD family